MVPPKAQPPPVDGGRVRHQAVAAIDVETEDDINTENIAIEAAGDDVAEKVGFGTVEVF